MPSRSRGITGGSIGWATLTNVATLLFHWRVLGRPNGGPIVSSPSSCPWQRSMPRWLGPVLRRLNFRRNLTKMMLGNRLDEYGVAPNSPIHPRRVSNTPHVIKKRARNDGRYDSERRQFKRVSTVYLARPCTVCRKDTWDYCSCDPSIDLCSACFGAHRAQHCG